MNPSRATVPAQGNFKNPFTKKERGPTANNNETMTDERCWTGETSTTGAGKNQSMADHQGWFGAGARPKPPVQLTQSTVGTAFVQMPQSPAAHGTHRYAGGFIMTS
jgi:hypothetical protein